MVLPRYEYIYLSEYIYLFPATKPYNPSQSLELKCLYSKDECDITVKTRHSANVKLMLANRLRSLSNINITLVYRGVFAGQLFIANDLFIVSN